MKAKIKQRIAEERRILGGILPLDTPFVLLVDPSNLCNFRCKFCPSGDHDFIKSTGRYQGNLDFNVFKKIIDDTKEFSEPIRVLRLYKEGEPLINPHFADMVKYAKDSGRILSIDTTTNGLLLNKQLNRKIIQAGLNQINISVGVSSEQIYQYAQVKIDFQKYYDNIRDLYENKGDCEIYIKSIKELLTPEEQTKFYNLFGNISDRVYLEHLSPAWPQFQFHDIMMKFASGHYGQPIVNRKVCTYIFYIMVINSDGKADTCVGDWKHILTYGDTRTTSLKELWDGSKITSLRLLHLKGLRSNIDFCKDCLVVSHGTLDDIDPYAEEILWRMRMR